MKSSSCGFSGLGVTEKEKIKICVLGGFMTPLYFSVQQATTYFVFLMQNLHKERRVGLFYQQSNKITMSIFSFMAG